ncbi:hypothetical protein MTP99_003558 [Tenebrio molitor]|nr:hypothetical protein MTP99_003558 [Tenebrio molitor]
MNVELSDRNKGTDKQERRERIKESRYNRECETEERENRYWMEGEERRCRMCYEERETTIEHMWIGCSKMREG